ncbi:MAG: hypothetical protein H6810_05335 [Phycisphaeraceae bacterium]|nr:MAG: hypothetical protein H6810_05335 [Phycisphaeraceae bacterium]
MPSSYRALCSDFYINQKISVKLDLPRGRETILDLFERIRTTFPTMASFKRYRDELALESSQADEPHRWLAVRASTIRSGTVNPDTFDEGYALHRTVLEVAPYFLSISPLDVEYVELLYGFDLAASGNQDAIVADALLAGSPLGELLGVDHATTIDFQPLLGLLLHTENGAFGGESGPRSDGVEAHLEVKTRSGGATVREENAVGEPISVYVTLRRYEPVTNLKALPSVFRVLAEHAEHLIESHVLPGLVAPIRRAIGPAGL